MKLSELTLVQAKRKYLQAKEAYYNSDPVMSDAKFDLLEDHIRKLDPKWDQLRKTGVAVKNKKTEVELPEPMPSLGKAYPKDLPKWFGKVNAHDYIVMDKLDGSSVQLTYVKGKPTRLITRGDGLLGGDISFLIPHLNLPVLKAGDAVFRCEALLTKKTFDKKWADQFDNSRNMVNGILNRRDPHPALKDIQIVVLGAYHMTLPNGLRLAKRMGLHVVPSKTFKAEDLTPSNASKILNARREASAFEMDGLVIAPFEFVLSYKSNDKPKNIVAFKFNDEENATVVTVKRIIWQVTGRKRIVPKIEIKPTKMDGVMVKHAAAHNAKWMQDRGLGPGAQVKVLRSGGVIPKIVEVIKKGEFQPPETPYKVDGVHFVVSQPNQKTVRRIDVLNVVKFMKTLGIELVAGKTADQLYDVGLRIPADYIRAFGQHNLGNLIGQSGYQGKMGSKLYDEIRRVFGSTISLKKLMVASQIFGVGIGERKLSAIEAHGISMYELTNNDDFPSNYIEQVPGFSGKTSKVLDDGFEEWISFYQMASRYLPHLDGSLPRKKPATKGKLSGHKFSFTGFRDKDLEAKIVDAGGEVVNFGGQTTDLIYKAGGKASTKVEKAKAKGITVVEVSKFKV